MYCTQTICFCLQSLVSSPDLNVYVPHFSWKGLGGRVSFSLLSVYRGFFSFTVTTELTVDTGILTLRGNSRPVISQRRSVLKASGLKLSRTDKKQRQWFEAKSDLFWRACLISQSVIFLQWKISIVVAKLATLCINIKEILPWVYFNS